MVLNPKSAASSAHDETQNDKIEDLQGVLASSVLSGRVSTIQDLAAANAKYKPGDETLILCRVFIPKGTYNAIEVALIKGKNNRAIQMGIYADLNGAPDGPLAHETSQLDSSGLDGTFVAGALSPTCVLTAGAFCWLALVCDDKKIELASTLTIRDPVASLLRREKSKYGDTLGALPTSWDSKNEGAIPLIRLIEA